MAAKLPHLNTHTHTEPVKVQVVMAYDLKLAAKC